MKIICSGYQKTGTKSLCAALRLLGYKVFDFEEQFYYLGKDLSQVFENGWTKEDLQKIYKNVDVVVDIPSCLLWEQLHEAFPEAKIIHTERDSAEEWIRSLIKQLNSMQEEKLNRFISAITPTGSRFVSLLALSMRFQVSCPPLRSWWMNSINKQAAMLRYKEHNSHVRMVAPKKKTLFFKVSDGWVPLCAFLNKPMPEEPFPHRNKNGSITKEIINQSLLFKQIRKEMLIESFIFLTSLLLLRKYAVQLQTNKTMRRFLQFLSILGRKLLFV